ncbi:M56 family metallopeptidase [Rosistilla oblonga]|uniref:M56 family metallopeptidase n=1 Tax=Rosistilla oblonga TaxID=2527990 RepID=UPI003A96D9DC
MTSFEWLQIVLSYALQITLVLAFSWYLEWTLKSSQAKSRVWTSAFIGLGILLVAGLMLPKLQFFHPWSEIRPSVLLGVIEAEFIVGKTLLVLWVFGAAIVLSRWIFHFVQLHRFIRSTEPLDDERRRRCNTLVEAELCTIGKQPVQYRISPEDLGPFCYQFHTPYVFLPESLLAGDAVEMSHVLRHELTHLKTQHPMQLFIQKFLQTMFWFHPLVWASGQRAGLVREFVCDDASTSDPGTTATYLRTLVRVVENRAKPQSGTFAIGRTSSELRQRAMRLAAGNDLKSSVWSHSVSLLPILAALLISQIWLPINPLASSQSMFTRWPSWTANALHAFDIKVRDYERFEPNVQLHELMERQGNSASALRAN